MKATLPVTQDDFDDMALETKLSVIFNTLVDLRDSGFESADERRKFRSRCSGRIRALEKSDLKTKSISGFVGAITGFLTAFLQKPMF